MFDINVDMPAGSLRCDRFVRSSLASSMAGFIRGGREALLSSWRAAMVVSIVFDCLRAVVSLIQKASLPVDSMAYLAVGQLENQLDLIPLNIFRLHLRGHPSFGSIGLPCPCSHIIIVCHSTSRRGAPGGRQGEKRRSRYKELFAVSLSAKGNKAMKLCRRHLEVLLATVTTESNHR